MAITGKIPILPFVLLLIYAPTICSGHHRRILHQPFFPAEAFPPAAQPPRQQPPKYPFSSLFPPSKQNPFFPLSASSPPPPTTTTATVTFPANISSLPLPNPSPKPVYRNLVAVAVSLSILSAVLLAATAAVLLRRSRKIPLTKTETRRLFPAKTQFSDEPAPPPAPVPAPAGNRSGEFLYLGTLRGIEENYRPKNGIFSSIATSSAEDYQRLPSPELRPLPPLPRHQPFSSEFPDQEEEEEQFFSPNFSPNNNNNNNNNNSGGGNDIPNPILSSPKVVSSPNFQNKTTSSGNNLFGSSLSSSPTDSLSSKSPFIALNLSPRSLNSNSPDVQTQPVFENSNSNQTHNSPFENHQLSVKTEPNLVQDNPFPARSPPPPPPLPPPRFWEFFEPAKGGQVVAGDLGRGEEESSSKPKLKPLHWDKVRASSDRAMVWDQIKSSTFQLNEEMIETLFMVNDPSSSSRENAPRLAYGRLSQENRVLDPKKSQNIAILLRALNVTIDEVCEALVEGTTDALGTELLESLLKMAPSKEEERKLKEFKDDPPVKLGPAEKFLKAVLDIPFAFQRVDAMLYVANFDSEVEYLTRSFETLKAACEELKNSGMFRKLLDAVLQTGNRMNVGTNRGDARAFKLDTLLKLIDIKGTDGKTTLLHFVVQEISRIEGSNLAKNNPSSTPVQTPESDFQDDIEFRKLGLRVVSSLSRELDNVKKAADMDSNVLGNEVVKLIHGVGKIKEILKLNEEFMKVESGKRFSESMNEFLNRAELEIVKLQNLESQSSCSVKEITEYFHGDSGNEEAHRFRIFRVVSDFISILDVVCKEVEKVNERSFVGSGCPLPLPIHLSFLPVFPGFETYGRSNYDESSS